MIVVGTPYHVDQSRIVSAAVSAAKVAAAKNQQHLLWSLLIIRMP